MLNRVGEQKGCLHGEGALVLTTASVQWFRIGGSSPAVSGEAKGAAVLYSLTSSCGDGRGGGSDPHAALPPCATPSVSFSCGGARRSWVASATAEGEDGRGYQRVGMDTPDSWSVRSSPGEAAPPSKGLAVIYNGSV
jgi:hypothetical protein